MHNIILLNYVDHIYNMIFIISGQYSAIVNGSFNNQSLYDNF